jgi:hypothetical protein
MSGALLASQIVERAPLVQTAGNSGNPIERVTLADGRQLVFKRVSPEWDWLTRATNDDGRIVRAWDRDVFERMPASIDHAMVHVERDGSEWHIFMRDVADTMVPEDVPHDRAVVRRILGAVADMHLAFWGEEIPGLCSIEDRYGMLSLRTAEREKALGAPGDLIFRAWDLFRTHARPDMVEIISALSADATSIADELRTCEQTLIHGDLRIGNTGIDGDRVVLVDWGERVGMAPPAVELAWFIGFDAKRLDVSRDEIVEDFTSLYGERFDPRAFDLAMIGGFVQLAAHLGLGFLGDDEAAHRAAAEELDWWTETVDRAFERTWSPPSI